MTWDLLARGLLTSTVVWLHWMLWGRKLGAGNPYSPSASTSEPWTRRLDPTIKRLASVLAITAAVFVWPLSEGKANMAGILYQMVNAPEQPGPDRAADAYTGPSMNSAPGRGGESLDGQDWQPLRGG